MTSWLQHMTNYKVFCIQANVFSGAFLQNQHRYCFNSYTSRHSLHSWSDSRTDYLKINQVSCQQYMSTPMKPVIQLNNSIITRRNVKRSDSIGFNLMALLTKKTTRKLTINGPDTKKSENRPGLVPNVLNRNASTLSRDKIRNKIQKRQLSEKRKALLAAKAKKKRRLWITNSSDSVQ